MFVQAAALHPGYSCVIVIGITKNSISAIRNSGS
jgi:hypothetical protein